MQLINIEKRDVKHARIQVTENFSVKLIVPTDFNEEEITKLKQKKMSWIMGNLDFFSSYQNEVIPYQEDEILLFGKGYKVNMYYRKPGQEVPSGLFSKGVENR